MLLSYLDKNSIYMTTPTVFTLRRGEYMNGVEAPSVAT